jgi:hypothetical protein
MRQALVTLLMCGMCFAAPVTVTVVDGSGAPAKDVLVIIQSLDTHQRDVTRKLTNEQGGIGTLELKAGLYRAIATTPYGLWRTAIREFIVSDAKVGLSITVEPEPTHGRGDVVTVGTATADLQVLKPDGTPASGAEVLVRDRSATLYLERWYRVDKDGRSRIELVGAPTIVVVLYEGKLISTQLTATDTHAIIKFSPD